VNIMIANNQDEFYDAIQRCITDEEFCLQVGANARKLIEEKHDLNKVTRQLIAFYEKVM
jgi:glycosyltransferase involved in cell wall biosynthesis